MRSCRVRRMMLGTDRFVYDDELKKITHIPDSILNAMITIGEFPIKRPDDKGGYGWQACEIADWADYYAFTVLAHLYPEKYIRTHDHDDHGHDHE